MKKNTDKEKTYIKCILKDNSTKPTVKIKGSMTDIMLGLHIIYDSIVEKIAADTGDLKDVVEDTVLTFLKITKLNIWIN